MPKEHLYYRNINQHDGSFYRSWARKFGQNMWLFIDLLLKKSNHEEQAYNSCMGILQACEDTSYNVVEEVASTCLKSNTVYYTGCSETEKYYFANFILVEKSYFQQKVFIQITFDKLHWGG